MQLACLLVAASVSVSVSVSVVAFAGLCLCRCLCFCLGPPATKVAGGVPPDPPEGCFATWRARARARAQRALFALGSLFFLSIGEGGGFPELYTSEIVTQKIFEL